MICAANLCPLDLLEYNPRCKISVLEWIFIGLVPRYYLVNGNTLAVMDPSLGVPSTTEHAPSDFTFRNCKAITGKTRVRTLFIK